MWPVIISVTILVYCVANILFDKLFHKQIRLEQRINEIKSSDNQFKSQEAITEKKVKQFKFVTAPKKLKLELAYAGIPLRAEEFVLIWISVAFAPAILVIMFGGGVLQAIILFLLGASIPPIIVKSKRKKRIERFNQQLGNALMVISNSLRAGFTFEQALSSVSKDMPSPVCDEFSRAVRELKYGGSMETSLFAIAERMKSKDFELLTSAVMIQKQVGGNLSDIVETISETIQDRIKIKNSIRTLTAQGRISGLIIGLLPVALLVILTLINPSYMSGLFESNIGKAMIVVAVLLEIIGFAVIRKIVNIKM